VGQSIGGKDGKGGNHRKSWLRGFVFQVPAAAPPQQERQKQSHPVINATLTHCQVASESVPFSFAGVVELIKLMHGG
jgi:hypothetical protein